VKNYVHQTNKTTMANQIFQGIDTIIVRVSDINRSKLWYQEKLGLQPVYEHPEINLVVLDTNSATSLTVWQTANPIQNNKETASYPIFRTSDAKTARQNLLDKRVDVSELITDDVIKYFQFFDPDNNVLEACEVHNQE
jgi:catechol 2,3-dioxygenase-like lactoylglutathione lyase family enzyme